MVVRVSDSDLLVHLNKLLERQVTGGSVTISFKRCT